MLHPSCFMLSTVTRKASEHVWGEGSTFFPMLTPLCPVELLRNQIKEDLLQIEEATCREDRECSEKQEDRMQWPSLTPLGPVPYFVLPPIPEMSSPFLFHPSQSLHCSML